MMLSDGKQFPSYTYQHISRDLNDLNSVFKDGVVDADEMKDLKAMGSQLNAYAKWAAENEGSQDSAV